MILLLLLHGVQYVPFYISMEVFEILFHMVLRIRLTKLDLVPTKIATCILICLTPLLLNIKRQDPTKQMRFFSQEVALHEFSHEGPGIYFHRQQKFFTSSA